MLMKAQKEVNKIFNIIQLNHQQFKNLRWNMEIIKIRFRPQLGQICTILALKKKVKISKNCHQQCKDIGLRLKVIMDRLECKKIVLKRLKVKMIKQWATIWKMIINSKNNLELFRIPKDIFYHNHKNNNRILK